MGIEGEYNRKDIVTWWKNENFISNYLQNE